MVTMKKQRQVFVVTLVSLVLLSMTAMASTGRYDQQIQQTASHKLHDAKHLQSVNSSVEDGIVILTGTVGLYQDKLDAAKKIKKLANVTGVRNDIAVAGETVPDDQLQQKLAKKLAYDRVGYYDNAFNYLALSVKDGVATISGDTLNDVAKDSALAIVARTPGVKDVVSQVNVLPVSTRSGMPENLPGRALARSRIRHSSGCKPASHRHQARPALECRASSEPHTSSSGPDSFLPFRCRRAQLRSWRRLSAPSLNDEKPYRARGSRSTSLLQTRQGRACVPL